MKVVRNNPPRQFEAGFEEMVTLNDCGTVALASDEQVTFITEGGAEYDVTRKEWGFYATPSVNRRLVRFGLRTVLVRNREGRWYVVLVEKGKEQLFEAYCRSEHLQQIGWLDKEATLRRLGEL